MTYPPVGTSGDQLVIGLYCGYAAPVASEIDPRPNRE